jgi:hypothetical protein
LKKKKREREREIKGRQRFTVKRGGTRLVRCKKGGERYALAAEGERCTEITGRKDD